MLEVRDLTCVRGDKTLFSALSFSVERGHAAFLHGPNGSGKTTLLRTIAGLATPELGSIWWKGAETRKLEEDYFAQLTYFGHLNGLKDELTGLENLLLSSRLHGRRVTEVQVGEALVRLGALAYQDLPTQVLSQGQKKRVALTRFLLSDAPLWILDEPFTALDVKAVETLGEVIAQHVRAGGVALLTTHQAVALPVERVRHIHLNE